MNWLGSSADLPQWKIGRHDEQFGLTSSVMQCCVLLTVPVGLKAYVIYANVPSSIYLFGIGDTAWSWFSSYLSIRSFSVQCNGVKSSPSHLNTGVPQGSVLGPILFIMYTTPLSSLISSLNTPSLTIRHHLYADDTQLLISFSPSDLLTAQSVLMQTFHARPYLWMDEV